MQSVPAHVCVCACIPQKCPSTLQSHPFRPPLANHFSVDSLGKENQITRHHPSAVSPLHHCYRCMAAAWRLQCGVAPFPHSLIFFHQNSCLFPVVLSGANAAGKNAKLHRIFIRLRDGSVAVGHCRYRCNMFRRVLGHTFLRTHQHPNHHIPVVAGGAGSLGLITGV